MPDEKMFTVKIPDSSMQKVLELCNLLTYAGWEYLDFNLDTPPTIANVVKASIDYLYAAKVIERKYPSPWTCELAPNGYQCMRKKGHEGPCAADICK